LLAFEDELEVLEHRLATDSMLLWPLARWRVLLGATLAAEPSSGGDAARPPISLRTRLRHLEASLRRDPLRSKRSFELVMFGSTVGVASKRDGKWFGRINDYFALENADDTLVIDASQDLVFREPRYPPHVAFHDAITIRAALRARISGGPAPADELAIGRFLRFLQEKLPIALGPAVLAALEKHLRLIAARAPFLRREYMRLFALTRAKVMFLEDASYGYQAYMLRWASESGLRTAEFQHGMITSAHQAYNYAPRLRESTVYRPYSPEYLLTYGRFWTRQTRTPSTVVEIGNPHFDAMRGASERITRSERMLVVVSQPNAAAELVALTEALGSLLPKDHSIVYRLHPHERAGESLYAPLRALRNVQISESGDVYAVLGRAGAVVGVSSTVLFEAAGLGLPVYVYSHAESEAAMPREFATWFATSEELSALLVATESTRVERDDFFVEGWRARYARFLREQLRSSR